MSDGSSAGEAFGAEAAWVAAVLGGVVLGDVAVLYEGFEAVIDGMATFTTGDFHEPYELFDFSFAEAGLNAGVDAEGLGGEDPALDIRAGEKPLADHRFEDIGELGRDLLLLIRGEEIHDALDGFGGINGVEGADDKVSGFCGGHGDLHGFTVSQFANDDDIGVLSHALTESKGKGFGVAADLALFHERGIVLEGKLDRVLKGDDGAGPQF